MVTVAAAAIAGAARQATKWTSRVVVGKYPIELHSHGNKASKWKRRVKDVVGSMYLDVPILHPKQ